MIYVYIDGFFIDVVTILHEYVILSFH